MSLESDVAGQALNLELELVRFLGQSAAKVVGKLSAGTVAAIIAIYKKVRNKKDLAPGEIHMKKMFEQSREHGYELQELYIPAEIKKEFAKTIKQRGINVAFVKNKKVEPPVYTATVFPYDAPRVDRIIEELKIDTVDIAKNPDTNTPAVQREHMNEKDAENFFEAMNPEEVIEEPDPFPTSRTTEDRSKNGSESFRSENTEDIHKGEQDKPDVVIGPDSPHEKSSTASQESRKSIMERMNQIKEKRNNDAKENTGKEAMETIINFAEKAKEIKEKGREQ